MGDMDWKHQGDEDELIFVRPLEGDDNRALRVYLSPEGIVIDLFDEDGDCMATMSMTAQEIADNLLK